MVSELGFREFAINKLRSKGLVTDFWSAILKNETICYFWGKLFTGSVCQAYCRSRCRSGCCSAPDSSLRAHR